MKLEQPGFDREDLIDRYHVSIFPIGLDKWGREEDEQPEFDREDLTDRYHVSISQHQD